VKPGKAGLHCPARLQQHAGAAGDGPSILFHSARADNRIGGGRELLVYCESTWCNHSATLDADWLPDETPVRSLRHRMVCTRCGLVGADVRPDWLPHTNKNTRR
jgi:hypothetical protein